MKGVMNILAKAGLVTLDEHAPAAAESPAPSASPAVAPAAVGEVTEVAEVAAAALDLPAIYAEFGVAPCSYPAERLARVLDGLKALDAATRLITIRAIDEADDTWALADPLNDARAKLRVLDAYAADVRAAVDAGEQEADRQRADISTRADAVAGEIRQQIAELQALLERESGKAQAERAAIDVARVEARAAGAQRLAAVDAERRRLTDLVATFAAEPAAASSGA